MNRLDAQLFLYDTEKCLAAFITATRSKVAENVLIFVGGMEDGFMSNGCLGQLKSSLSGREFPRGPFSICQPILSSSYKGFGISSLETDVKELDSLIKCLISQYKTQNIVLYGFSTGAQDCVLYLKTGAYKSYVRALILQCPVSDREWLATQPNYEKNLNTAKAMIDAGKGAELMDRSTFPGRVPITASRYYSLASRHGDDDYFSSDFGQQEMGDLLGHITVPTRVIGAEQDEYVKQGIQRQMVDRISSSVSSQISGQKMFFGRHYLNDYSAGVAKEIFGFLWSIEQQLYSRM